MHLFESGRYTVNYKSQFFGRLLEYGPIEISDAKKIKTLGTLARLTNLPDDELQFSLEYSLARRRPAGLFAKQFGKRNDTLPVFAWNGGYSYAAALLKQMKASAVFEGVPAGMLVFDSQLVSLPLFGQDVITIDKYGRLGFAAFSLANGVSLACNSRKVFISGEALNLSPQVAGLPDFCMYDANYQGEILPANERTVIFLGGTTIKEVYRSESGQPAAFQPLGIALSIADHAFPPNWDMREKDLAANLPGLENIVFAVETGPSFTWKAPGDFSLHLNTAWQQLFYPDLNQAKSHLVCGLDANDNLLIASITNGADEYAGINFYELPAVLESLGFVYASLLDDGNSSSLYRGIERIHITENDPDANFNPFSDQPQPGTASSALIAF